jgi:transposase
MVRGSRTAQIPRSQRRTPKDMKGKVTRADMAMGIINKLYVIERQIKSLTMAEIYQGRQQKSLSILKQLNKWLAQQLPRVDKGGLTGEAMPYLHNQWEKLIVYRPVEAQQYIG